MCLMMCDFTVFNGEDLDKQYSPSMWSKRLPPNFIVTHHIQVLAGATAHAQKVLECDLSVCYDKGSGQVLDIYTPQTQLNAAIVLIYFHGGYWKALGVEHSGFLAENCSARGVTTVAVGYDLAPKAGGHLSATMLYTDWSQYGIDSQPLSGAILLSGVYDLSPVKRSCVNEGLNLTDDEVQVLSPQKNLELIQARLPTQFPCLIAVGEDESDEFRRQSKDFHQGLLSVGVASKKLTLDGIDHFDVLEKLTDKSFTLTQSIFDFMNM